MPKHWSRPDHQTSYEYIRKAYDVPAYVGLQIRFRGRPGHIVNPQKSTPYVHIKLDGGTKAFPVHPCEDTLEYLAPNGRLLDSWHRHCANDGKLPASCHCRMWERMHLTIGEACGLRAFRSMFA